MDHDAALPGGIGVSRLQVYDTQTVDGLVGGSAHVHLACTEGYVVLDGEGAVQTLGPDGFAETPLRRGSVVWFTPGIIHRLVNRDRRLEILTLMQNAGLPEAGDAVLTFPAEVLASPARYQEANQVGGDDVGTPQVRQAALRRRDLAVDGFTMLRERVEAEGPAALREFYGAAVALVRDRVPRWRERWRAHSLRAAQLTGDQLDRIEAGDAGYLFSAVVNELSGPTASNRPGMCGALDVYHHG
jgi:mannose-6-phosphate isomerase-like protein (cupin superfamily)